MRFSLRTKILLPILGIVALALTISLYFVVSIAKNTIIESSEHSLHSASLTLKNAVLQEVGRAKADVQIASAIPVIRDVLDHIDYPLDSLVRNLKVEKGNEFLQSLVTIFGYYESFYLTTDKGIVATSAFSDIVNKLDISNRDWFHETMKVNGPVILSDPFVSRFTGQTLISQAMRINSEGLSGAVVGVLRLQQMLQPAFQETQTELIQTLLVNQDGLILAKFTDEAPLTKKDKATLEAEQIEKEKYKDAPWLQHLQKNDTGFFMATIDNVEKLVSFERVEQSQMYSLALAPKAALLAPAKHITNIGQIILVVSLLLSCLVIFFVVAPIIKTLQELSLYAKNIGNGEFENIISVKRNDELGGMANSLVQMSDNLQSMIITAEAKTAEAQEQTQLAQQARESAELAKNEADVARRQGILDAASQLSDIFGEALQHIETLQSTINEATQGTHMQQDRIEETSNAIITLNTAVGQILDNSSRATEVATQTINNANSGAKVVGDVAQAVGVVNTQVEELRESILELNQSAQGISGTLSVISDIADQTNLLALNAAIEAARAGDAGRGFAVVADEVRKLADNTMVATREIHTVIQEIQKQASRNIERMDSAATSVEQTVDLAGIAAKALQEIVHFADSSVSMVASITDASRNQSTISKNLEEGGVEINDVANANTRHMNKASEAVYSLGGVAKRIEQLITELQQS